jgi:hypothetical protein
MIVTIAKHGALPTLQVLELVPPSLRSIYQSTEGSTGTRSCAFQTADGSPPERTSLSQGQLAAAKAILLSLLAPRLVCSATGHSIFQTLKEKRAEGGYQRFIGRIARTPLLIFDDFGLAHLDAQERLSLLEIIEDRLGRAATIIATQIPVAKWFDVVGDPTIADAICDRIVPQAIRITLSGKSMRAIKGRREQSDACAIPAT